MYLIATNNVVQKRDGVLTAVKANLSEIQATKGILQDVKEKIAVHARESQAYLKVNRQDLLSLGNHCSPLLRPPTDNDFDLDGFRWSGDSSVQQYSRCGNLRCSHRPKRGYIWG